MENIKQSPHLEMPEQMILVCYGIIQESDPSIAMTELSNYYHKHCRPR